MYQPLDELLIKETVRESLPDNTDTFKYTIAPKLFENKFSLNNTTLLLHVWQDTPEDLWLKFN